MFEKIKRFYDLKLYTDKHVRKFCEKGIINADQYKKITSDILPDKLKTLIRYKGDE